MPVGPNISYSSKATHGHILSGLPSTSRPSTHFALVLETVSIVELFHKAGAKLHVRKKRVTSVLIVLEPFAIDGRTLTHAVI
jgi:hypothetical protein